MHANQRAILRRLPHRLEDRRVVDHQHVGVSHEQFEAGHALAHHVVHVFEACVAEVGHDHVQPVVDAGLALGLLPPRIERRAHLRPARLDGKIDNRRRPANCGRACPGLKIIGGVRPAERHVEMGMRIDAARQHQQSGSINNSFRRARRDPRTNFLDDRSVDQQIGLYRRVGIHDGSVLNENRRHKGPLEKERLVEVFVFPPLLRKDGASGNCRFHRSLRSVGMTELPGSG